MTNHPLFNATLSRPDGKEHPYNSFDRTRRRVGLMNYKRGSGKVNEQNCQNWSKISSKIMKTNKNSESAKEAVKTNEVAWDAIRSATNPEKMFWTAGIELYRCVMSNGPYGFKKNAKRVNIFLDFGPP